ncbi:MAG TPA: hypothetical protein VL486_07040 [Verrucomicrobiae bacterium]|nr:hypothetical protein [Verrucomicrobiae bacterium]
MIDERAITRMTQQIAAAYVDTQAIQYRFVPEPRLKTTGEGYMKSLGAAEFASRNETVMLLPKKWLEPIPWDVVEFINQSACTRGQAQFGHTSDGYAQARQLWEQAMDRAISLEEALDICLRCRRLAPFLNFNVNTFAGIAKAMVREILPHLGPKLSQAFESVVGHYVAGTEGHEALVSVVEEVKRKLGCST